MKNRRLISFIIFTTTLILVTIWIGLNKHSIAQSSNNIQTSKNQQVDIGTTSFELFRQILAYSYKYFVEDINLKDKLNQTLKEIYRATTYVGMKTKLYQVSSQNIQEQVNQFENYYNELFNQIINSQVDIEKALDSKNISTSYKELYTNFYNSIRTKEGYLKFVIQSYCSALDKYTSYMGPREYRIFKENIQGGNFSGIGVVMFRDNKDQGEIIITEVIEDSPAQRSGIKAGDRIIKVDDIDITNLSLDTVQSMIRGPENTKVKLTLRRENQIIELEIIRKIIQIKSVKSFEKNKYVVFVIKSFSENTSKEFLDHYVKMNNPSSFIIDLRNNGGGVLEEAINILSYFIGPNKIGVILKQKNNQQQYFYTKHQKQINFSKVVLLVNGYTASASEILAQSLKDYLKDDLIIIGEKTYGKNTVQTLYNLIDRGALKLTIGKFFTISERDIYKERVYLDYEVVSKNLSQNQLYTEKDSQYMKAIEILSRQ
ncbi:MAG: S41 family peptidase [bacterium]